MLAISAQAQENPSLDDQLRAHLHKDYFSLNLLIQSEGRLSFKDDDFQGGRSFNAANAWISMRGNLKGGFFYRIFVDRTTMTGLLVGSRESGIAATGDIGGFYCYAGEFNGNHLENNNNNKFYGIGRLQYTVKDPLPGYIQFAVSGSQGNSEGTISGSRGLLLRGKITILGSDLELELNRFYFATEYLRGDLETVDLPNVNELISGYYFTGGFSWSEKTKTFARWQSWSYKELGATESKLTLGTNIEFTDIVGLVLNLDMYKPNQGDNMFGASFIFQVQF